MLPLLPDRSGARKNKSRHRKAKPDFSIKAELATIIKNEASFL